jgi:enediyne biosynthesis protein E4
VTGHVYPELEARKSGEEYRNPRLVYRNLGNGRFEDVSARSGPAIGEKHSSRGAAFGDFDNDGDVDALVMNMNEPPSLLRNEWTGSSNHWIRLKLEGTKSNRSAIGAVVSLGKQKQAVLSQSSFTSQSDLRLHFGLGPETETGEITVIWPNGGKQVFASVKADREVRLVEQ